MAGETEQQPSGQRNSNPSNFEQDLVNRIAREFLTEQRRSRRWSIFFKLLLALYLVGFLAIYLLEGVHMASFGMGKHTSLIEINGVIAADADASADNIVTGLRAAFEDRETAGIILRINSPGGSPVQAGYVNDEINRLRNKHPDIPVYAVITDLCASGGYYIASAADKIYADKASIVGSIGVIMSGFGFVNALEKLGIERRVYHAGDNKAFMDPFSPARENEVAHVQTLLENIHQQFINVVKKGRGERLKDDTNLFTGLIWTGEEAVNLGLVDALGSASYVAREIIGAKDIIDYTYRRPYLDRFAERLGAVLAEQITSYLNTNINNIL
jgi:protease-4